METLCVTLDVHSLSVDIELDLPMDMFLDVDPMFRIASSCESSGSDPVWLPPQSTFEYDQILETASLSIDIELDLPMDMFLDVDPMFRMCESNGSDPVWLPPQSMLETLEAAALSNSSLLVDPICAQMQTQLCSNELVSI